MKITLISPYDTISCIGLRRISSILKTEGYDVRLVFMPKFKHTSREFNRLYTDQELNQLIELIDDSLFVGISVSTNYLPRVAQMCNTFRAANDRLLLVWGGIHPTVLPESSLTFCDYACIGEGDKAVIQFAKAIEKNRTNQKIHVPNFWYKKNGKLIQTGIMPLTQKLDELPPPDFSLQEHYILHQGEIKPLTTELFQKYLDTNFVSPIPDVQELPFHTSHGCPQNCTFCCNSIYFNIYGKNWKCIRTISPEVLISQLSKILSQHDFIRLIFFSDDDFLQRSLADLELFAQLYEKDISLPFRCYFTPTTLTEKKLKILLDAGLYTFSMGFQSGSDRTNIEIYKRKVYRKQSIRAIEIVDKYKDLINTPVYHIVEDNPFETKDDIHCTHDLIKTIPTYWKGKYFSLTFYPGTELYRKAVAEGIIQNFENEVVYKDFEKKIINHTD